MKIKHLMSIVLLLVATSLNNSTLHTDTGKTTAILAGGCFWCVESDQV